MSKFSPTNVGAILLGIETENSSQKYAGNCKVNHEGLGGGGTIQVVGGGLEFLSSKLFISAPIPTALIFFSGLLHVHVEHYLQRIVPAVGADFRRLYPANAKTSTCCQATTIAPRWQTLWRQHGPFGGTLARMFGPRIWRGRRTPLFISHGLGLKLFT